jgi:hypothetical protein
MHLRRAVRALIHVAHAKDSRVNALSVSAAQAEAQIQQLFTNKGAEWAQLRHAEAGCFIACIVPLSS